MASDFDLNELLKSVPIGDIAEDLGVDRDTADAAVRQALPGLLGGLAVNSQSSEGAQSLTAALKKHEGAELAPPLTAVDTEDGKKIVRHVLGDQEDAVARALGQNAGGGIGELIPKLLPVLAPIVMAFLANKMSGGGDDRQSGGIGDLLGGLLGGGSGEGSASQDGGIGDLLGGLLGGGSGGSGGLGGLLGGLLGGNK